MPPCNESLRGKVVEKWHRVHAPVVGGTMPAMSFCGQRRRPAPAAGDYESELTNLCGNRRRADEMIRAEMRARPELSRVGAALALVTRLRHQKHGYARPL